MKIKVQKYIYCIKIIEIIKYFFRHLYLILLFHFTENFLKELIKN